MSPKPAAILFSDFDGTITLQDSNDYLTDTLGMGHSTRMGLNEKLKDQSLSFSEGFYKMLYSIAENGHSFEECIELLLKNISLDSGFKETAAWCIQNGIPVVIVSSGMEPIIKALVHKLVGDELGKHIIFYANDVQFSDSIKFKDLVENDGGWRIKYRDTTPFGHDKQQSIDDFVKQTYGDGEKGLLFYCGDGVSDISASKSCDVLFAKKGLDLVDICQSEGIPCIEFETFSDILSTIKQKLNN